MDGAGLVHVPAKPCVTRSTVHQGYEPALLVTQLGLFGETSRDKEKTGAVWHQWSRLEDRVQVESGKDAHRCVTWTSQAGPSRAGRPGRIAHTCLTLGHFLNNLVPLCPRGWA